jgi:CheY-like chemotaxis protein
VGLTQQLLTFSKGGAPIKQAASITEVIKDSCDFALRGSKVRCEHSFPEVLWPVEIDVGQISQVIQNLIINAEQAMPQGGVIRLSVENLQVVEDLGLALEPGKYLKICVRDGGVGIPEEILPRIFDPYFTTKQKGSGLGLATTYSIINRHDGHISVESEVGVGTTFHIYLRASEQEIYEAPAVEKGLTTYQGRILLMDDQEYVRKVAGEMLKHMGYEVEFAADGAEAVASYKQAREYGMPFNVVIMDMTIPGGIGGKEAIRRLLQVDPHVKAIVSSGYSTDPVMADFSRYGFSGVVAKPYRLQELGEVVHRVLTDAPMLGIVQTAGMSQAAG